MHHSRRFLSDAGDRVDGGLAVFPEPIERKQIGRVSCRIDEIREVERDETALDPPFLEEDEPLQLLPRIHERGHRVGKGGGDSQKFPAGFVVMTKKPVGRQ